MVLENSRHASSETLRNHPSPHNPKPEQTHMPVNLFTLFMAFLKAGGLTVGNGYAIVEPLRHALVSENKWLTEENFSADLAIVQAMPGIFSLNLAICLGKRIYGRRGMAAALTGTLLPALVILIVLATCFDSVRHFPAVETFLKGARPAIVAAVLLPCLKMWRHSGIVLSTVWIPVGAALAIVLLGVSPTYIIIALTVLGLLYGFLVRADS